MAQRYQSRLASSDNPSALMVGQTYWWRNERDKCVDDACLIAAYNDRIRVLGGHLRTGAPPPPKRHSRRVSPR
jgi:uncharacterized protein